MMTLFIAPLLAAAGMQISGVIPAEGDEHDLAEKRLRSCLVAGTSSQSARTLAEALQSARVFCRRQIDDLAEIRVRDAVHGLDGEAADRAKKQTIRSLNDEIAYAVANFTGLTQ